MPTAEIKRLHEEGLSTREIGDRVGLHQTTVWRRLERASVWRPKAAEDRFTLARKKQAAQLYLSGAGLREVARSLGLRHNDSAAKVLRSIGVTIRPEPSSIARA